MENQPAAVRSEKAVSALELCGPPDTSYPVTHIRCLQLLAEARNSGGSCNQALRAAERVLAQAAAAEAQCAAHARLAAEA